MDCNGNNSFVYGGVDNPNAPPVQEAPVAAPDPAEVLEKPVQMLMPMPIIVKEEPVEFNESDESNAEMVSNNDEEIENGGKIPFKEIFPKHKKSSERTLDQKLLQNRQLRKLMLPKNALVALNEIKGINVSDFTINSNPNGGFTAIVTVNSITYEGKGHSKRTAKNLACEKAFRDYIIAKMTPRIKSKAQSQKPTNEADSSIVPIEENDGESDEATEDDVPMLTLASFALYKLFAEWEREGYMVPEMHPSAAGSAIPPEDPYIPAVPKEPKKPPVRTELPSSWETMHPATLLCIMRPGVSFVDYGCILEKSNILQRFGVIVDNQEFSANGRSKKIARRNVAVNACNSLFNTSFLYEEY